MLWDVLAPTFCLDNWLTERRSICQPDAPLAIYPQEDSLYSFLLEAEGIECRLCVASRIYRQVQCLVLCVPWDTDRGLCQACTHPDIYSISRFGVLWDSECDLCLACIHPGNLYNSIGKTTGYGLVVQGSIPDSSRRFLSTPQCPDRLRDPPRLLFNGYQRLFPPEVTRLKRGTDQSPPSSVEIRNNEAIPQLHHMSSWRKA
jgi:hypothetical protein